MQTNSKSYNVTARNVTNVTTIIINENMDYFQNIKDDIKNFYKMYILYYFFKNYITNPDENTEQNNSNNNVISNYDKFIDIEKTINVVQQT